MCGIAGFLSLEQGVFATKTSAQAMCDVIVHRGPDGQGFLVDGPLAMGMRRLSIIDLAGGQQPISNEDGTISVIQNGEIYNFREIREDLEKRGHRFKTNSDTEAIVHLYEEYGTRCVEHLRGMFALAIWDAPRRRLLVARDRLGIKPLYYSVGNGRLLFGSELKSLLAVGLDREIDQQALHDYLSLTYVPAPATIFKAARKLMPGSMLIAERGNVRIERYWTLSFEPDEKRFHDEREIVAEVRERVEDAVRSHLVSDVPLGVFLSGGVDSATLVACMRKFHTGPLKTFSIGFAEKSFSELDRARDAAKHFGTEHHEMIVTPDAVTMVPELTSAFDEPYADSSAIPVLCVARLARQSVTVALTGEGGDEVFAGYKTYAATRLAGVYRRAVPSPLHSLIAWGVNRLPVSHGKVSFDYMAKRFVAGASRDAVDAHFSWKATFDETAKQTLYRERRDVGPTVRLYHEAVAGIDPRDLLSRLLMIDTRLGLEGDMLVKADRMSMATSLEGRVPLLDHPLVEMVAAIPSRFKMRGMKTKVLLRAAMADALPPETTQGPKQGFNVPIPSWLNGPLRELVRDTLSPSRIAATGIFRPEPIQELIRAHEKLERDHSRDIWTLLMFQSWYDRIGQGVQGAEQDRLVG
ncbi:MAG: asparagine synthase (glutamine-hydrolyzing) [Deltaproteobacteria bacterium]|nr:asparagine synthase (glutamine-hydrolyzing) [Deltaproteobacteria bacterium]